MPSPPKPPKIYVPGTPLKQQCYEMGVLHRKLFTRPRPFLNWSRENQLSYLEGYYSHEVPSPSD